MKSRNIRKKNNKRTKKSTGGGKPLYHNLKGFTYMIQPFIPAKYLTLSFFANPHDGLAKYIEHIEPDLKNDRPLDNPEFKKLFEISETVIINTNIDNELSKDILNLTNYMFTYCLSLNTNINIRNTLEKFLPDYCNAHILCNLAKSDLVELITQEMIKQHIVGKANDFIFEFDLFNNEPELLDFYNTHEYLISTITYNNIYFHIGIFDDKSYDMYIDSLNKKLQSDMQGIDSMNLIKIINKIRENEKKHKIYQFLENLSENPNDIALDIIEEMHNLIWPHLEKNPNDRALEIIENRLNAGQHINWFKLSENTNDRAIALLENNQHLIKWDNLCNNTNDRAIALVENHQQLINWGNLSRNTNNRAVNLIINKAAEHPDAIDWWYFSKNTNSNALIYLSQNKKHIQWNELSQNENDIAIDLLLGNNVSSDTILYNKNPKALPLFEREVLYTITHMISYDSLEFNLSIISKNPLIFTKNEGKNKVITLFEEQLFHKLYNPHSNLRTGQTTQQERLLDSISRRELHGHNVDEFLPIINETDENGNVIENGPSDEQNASRMLVNDYLTEKYKNIVSNSEINKMPSEANKPEKEKKTVFEFTNDSNSEEEVTMSNWVHLANKNDSQGGKRKKTYKTKSRKQKRTRKNRKNPISK